MLSRLPLQPLHWRWSARIVLVFAGVPPTVYGVGAMIEPNFIVEYARVLSSADGTLSPEMRYLARPLGVYIGLFGAMTLFAARDPFRYRHLMAFSAAGFLVRGAQRYALSDELYKLFGISPVANAWHSAYLVLLAALLLALRGTVRPQAGTEAHSSPAGTPLPRG